MTSPAEIEVLRRQARNGLRLIGAGMGMLASAAARLLWIAFKRLLGIVFVLVLLFEQWGWRPLSAGLAWLARFGPLAALERQIARLPPYAALVAFVLPTVLLVPLKLLAIYLIANGHALTAGALFVGAKIAGTAIVARLYQLTSPQLMHIGWVKKAHDVLMPRLHDLHEAIRASWGWRVGRIWKARLKRIMQPYMASVKAKLLELTGFGRASFRD